MKMTLFKILTLFVVTTTAFGRRTTTTDQSQRVNLDIDTIEDTCIYIANDPHGCLVNFGAFGVRQVVIYYKNYTTNLKMIKLHVGNDYFTETEIAAIDVATAIKVHETAYEVTEMVNIESGYRNVFLTTVKDTTHEQIEMDNGSYATNLLEVMSIYFIPKTLNSESPYRIISTSNNLGITIKSWDKRLRDKITPMLYDSICEDRQSFYFQQNEKGDFRIMKNDKGKTEHDAKYLEVRDRSRKIGNEVILVKYPGSKDNVWSLLPGRSDGEVKIQSKLTGTCISAIHGLGSNLVLVDCENGKDNDWTLKFCDG